MKNGTDGFHNDFTVQSESQMIDVPVVEADSFIPINGSAAIHLGPAGDPGPDIEHPALNLCILCNGPGMIGQRRSGTDKAHIASDNVDELRQLIKGMTAKKAAHPGNTEIMFIAVNPASGML